MLPRKAIFPTLLSLFSLCILTSAVSFDCKKVIAKGVEFKLEALGGLHSVSWSRKEEPGYMNTTFKIDICNPLKLEGRERKECKPGTQICGIETYYENGEGGDRGVIPIMRNYEPSGAKVEPKKTLLSDSDSNGDSKMEGLRLDVGGGQHKGKAQRAIIEFICKKDDEPSRARRDSKPEDGDDDDKDGDSNEDPQEWRDQMSTSDGAGGTIQFQSYSEEKGMLRLNWLTPHGCEGSALEPTPTPSGGWGFFSWFFFLIFMGLLAYFAVSMWMNYTRYGARGWGLLPHADLLQDLPYILADWWRKIVGTVSGGGSRGGYSAV